MTGNAIQIVENRRTEYAIYTFGKAGRTGPRAALHTTPNWQKHGSLGEKAKALRIARNLFDTGRYGRIEVKSRIYDSRVNRRSDITLKTFGQPFGRAQQVQPGLGLVVFIAAGVGLAALVGAGLFLGSI